MKYPEEIINDAESIWLSLPFWKNNSPLRRIKLEDYLLEQSHGKLIQANVRLYREIHRMAGELQRKRTLFSIIQQVIDTVE